MISSFTDRFAVRSGFASVRAASPVRPLRCETGFVIGGVC